MNIYPQNEIFSTNEPDGIIYLSFPMKPFRQIIEEQDHAFLIFEKLKDFYAQPLDGCWPLRPCWVPDLEKPPRHVKSRNNKHVQVTSFRRFTFEEFVQILEMRKVKPE